MELQELSKEELKGMLKQVQEFRETQVYQHFQEEYEEAKKEALGTLTNLNIENLGAFFAREQALGAFSQVEIALRWFENLEELLTKVTE